MSKAHTQTKLQFIAHNTPTNTVVTVWNENSPVSTHYHPKGMSQDSAIAKTEADCRAVNSHAAMVEALEKITDLPYGGSGYGDQAVIIARAALALAKEGE